MGGDVKGLAPQRGWPPAGPGGEKARTLAERGACAIILLRKYVPFPPLPPGEGFMRKPPLIFMHIVVPLGHERLPSDFPLRPPTDWEP